MSIEALIDRAMKDRPELMAQTLRIRSAEARIRAARAMRFALRAARRVRIASWPR